MRVLFLSPAAQLGGAERCLIDCVAVLREAQPRVDVSVVTLADGPLVALCRELGAEVEVVAPPRVLTELGESGAQECGRALLRQSLAAPSVLRFLAVLRRAIARRRPEVVHSNGMKAHLLAGLLAPARARSVVHLHDFVGSRRASSHLLPALARLRARTTFIANSNAVAEDFRRIAPFAQVQTIYNVVDTAYFCPGSADPAWLAASAGLAPPGPQAVSFGLVATYARWKGHAFFIDAAGRLAAARPGGQFRFYIVGGPSTTRPVRR